MLGFIKILGHSFMGLSGTIVNKMCAQIQFWGMEVSGYKL